MSPTGEAVPDFAPVKLIEDYKNQEKIAHVATAWGICTYVTESGKLYAHGSKLRAFLELSETDEHHLPETLPLPD